MRARELLVIQASANALQLLSGKACESREARHTSGFLSFRGNLESGFGKRVSGGLAACPTVSGDVDSALEGKSEHEKDAPVSRFRRSNRPGGRSWLHRFVPEQFRLHPQPAVQKLPGVVA